PRRSASSGSALLTFPVKSKGAAQGKSRRERLTTAWLYGGSTETCPCFPPPNIGAGIEKSDIGKRGLGLETRLRVVLRQEHRPIRSSCARLPSVEGATSSTG